MCGDRQLRFRCEGTFLSPLHPRNPVGQLNRYLGLLPYNEIFSRHIFCLPHADLTLDVCRVQRRRYLEDHIVRIQFGIVVGSKVNSVFNAGFGGFCDVGLQPEGKVDIGGGPIPESGLSSRNGQGKPILPHKFKLAVGRDEADGPIRIKFA